MFDIENLRYILRILGYDSSTIDLSGLPFNDISEANWDNLEWPYSDSKPSFQFILQKYQEQIISDIKRLHFYGRGDIIREICEKRICDVAFGANSLLHELQIRNRLTVSNDPADHEILNNMNIWRNHYRGRYHELKTFLREVSLDDFTFEELREILETLGRSLRNGDPADLLWDSAEWTIPTTNVLFENYDSIPSYGDRSMKETPPPFDLKLAYTGSVTDPRGGHGFEIKSTAKSIVLLEADAEDITFDPVFVSLGRAGSVTFTAVGTASATPNRTITITVSASPYGIETTASVIVENW